MTTPGARTRPPQVTMAAWLIIGGSVMLVLLVFERIMGLHSLETRESAERFLSEPPGDDLGLDVSGVLGYLQALSMVVGGCATAAAILGFQVLQRSRSARLALTLLAVPLFLAGLVTGGFVSSVVAASAVVLWFQPARDWFDGVVREQRAQELGRPPAAADPAATSTPSGPGSEPAPMRAPVGDARPREVVWACVLTWVFAGLALAVMTTSMVVLATSPEVIFEELHRQNPDLAAQGVSDATLRTMTFVLSAIVVVWSFLALVAAALTFRRVAWARGALVVSSAGAVACCLLAVLGQVLLVLPLAASVVTLALLVRPDVRAWFDRTPQGRVPDDAA